VWDYKAALAKMKTRKFGARGCRARIIRTIMAQSIEEQDGQHGDKVALEEGS
jgi:hypothetical protein